LGQAARCSALTALFQLQVGTRITSGEERRLDEVAWALDILVQDGGEDSMALVWGCLKVLPPHCIRVVCRFEALFVVCLSQAAPEAAMEANPYGWLPIHSLCRYNNGPKAAVIAEWLLTVYPTGAVTPTPEGVASVAGIRSSTVATSTSLATGCGVRGPFGWYPLHLLSRYNSGPSLDEIASLLLLEDGEGPKRANPGDGMMPLHLMCMNPSPSKQLMTRLLRAYPKAANHRCFGGDLPVRLLSRYCSETGNQSGLSGFRLWYQEASRDSLYREHSNAEKMRLLQCRWEAMGDERRSKYDMGLDTHDMCQMLLNVMEDQPWGGEKGLTQEDMHRGVGESFVDWIKKNKRAGTSFEYPMTGSWTPTPAGKSSLLRKGGNEAGGSHVATPPPSDLLRYYQKLDPEKARTWVESTSGYTDVSHIKWT